MLTLPGQWNQKISENPKAELVSRNTVAFKIVVHTETLVCSESERDSRPRKVYKALLSATLKELRDLLSSSSR